MSKVFVYGFQGKYIGSSEYDYRTPEIGKEVKCILLIRQESNELDFAIAQSECKKYGFEDVVNLSGNELKVESLNTENGKKFQGHYHEALEQGSSLAIY
ncbi:hypothetical protein [Shewanella woodyi]|uniref:Uncharacterized protein n=1 Tax=Shewanella woodyi (strain ATCC 51908 / MS32) TaxID=392500 RepID=B1KD17_SHEWM|nr:hypothetical protein [Shewanella woodyi]ACA87852.1 hypothetical protein Swoo_3588 [Shewanella woodyi ATCC 51908]